MKPGTVGAVIVGIGGVAAAAAVFVRDGAQVGRAGAARDQGVQRLAAGDAAGAAPAFDEALAAAASVGGLTGRRGDALAIADDARRGLALCRALEDPDPRALARAVGPGGAALGQQPGPGIQAALDRGRAELLFDAGLALERRQAIAHAPVLLKAAVEALGAASSPRKADAEKALGRAELRRDLESTEHAVRERRDAEADRLAADLRERLGATRGAFAAEEAASLEQRIQTIVTEVADRRLLSAYEEKLTDLSRRVPTNELGALRAAAEAVSPPTLAGGHPGEADCKGRLDLDNALLARVQKAARDFEGMKLVKKSGSAWLFIDELEVTNEAYARFVAARTYGDAALWTVDERARGNFIDQTGRPGPKPWLQGAPAAGRERHPVVGVCLVEAEAYAKWAGKRLPTTDEWRAAAAPEGKPYPWGDGWRDGQANVKVAGQQGDTRPVGELPGGASPCGALDMIGNARELTLGPDGKPLVMGGSFQTLPAQASALGEPLAPSPTTRALDTGFRCARDLSWD